MAPEEKYNCITTSLLFIFRPLLAIRIAMKVKLEYVQEMFQWHVGQQDLLLYY